MQKLKTSALLFFGLFLFCMCGNTQQKEMPKADRNPEFSISGSLVFHSNMDGDNEIYLLTGKTIVQLTDNSWNDEYPAWSSDGKRIAFTANPEGHYDIYVMEADGSRIRRLTSTETDEKEPAWFPDGSGIAYSSEIKKFIRKQLTLWKVDVDTAKTERIIPGYNKGHAIPHISPQGQLITFTGKRSLGWDVALYDRRTHEVKFLDEGGKSCRARFSGDGKKLAYVSSKADGKGDIWMMNADGTDKRRLTERDETFDYFPAWSPDNRFIVFNSSQQHDHNGDWALYVLELKTGETRLLFDSPGNDVFPDWR